MVILIINIKQYVFLILIFCALSVYKGKWYFLRLRKFEFYLELVSNSKFISRIVGIVLGICFIKGWRSCQPNALHKSPKDFTNRFRETLKFYSSFKDSVKDLTPPFNLKFCSKTL